MHIFKHKPNFESHNRNSKQFSEYLKKEEKDNTKTIIKIINLISYLEKKNTKTTAISKSTSNTEITKLRMDQKPGRAMSWSRRFPS